MIKHPHTVIVIAGPTAAGKTALSLRLAKHFKTAIISADSRQCFKELNIGVAKPSTQELAGVKHYFINSHSIHDEVNAAVFEQYALHAAADIFKQQPIAIMVGGTGLYVKTFCEGMDKIPPVEQTIHEEVIQHYQQKGLQWLQNQLQQKDATFWQAAEQQNPQRLMRALEVLYATGRSITTFRNANKVTRSFNIIKIGIELPKQQLHNNINTRVDEMMENGLLSEATSILPYRNLNALQTVGYKELFEHLNEKISLPEAIEKIKLNTRHYAKRQLTWFKKDKDIQWFHPSQFAEIINYTEEKIY